MSAIPVGTSPLCGVVADDEEEAMASRKRVRGNSDGCCNDVAPKANIKEHIASLSRNPIDFIGFAKPFPVCSAPSKMTGMVRDINLELHVVEHRDSSHEDKELGTAWSIVKPVAPKADTKEMIVRLVRSPINFIRGSKGFTEEKTPVMTAREIGSISMEMY